MLPDADAASSLNFAAPAASPARRNIQEGANVPRAAHGPGGIFFAASAPVGTAQCDPAPRRSPQTSVPLNAAQGLGVSGWLEERVSTGRFLCTRPIR